MYTAGYFGAAVFFDFTFRKLDERGHSSAAAIATAKAISLGNVFFLDAVWHLIPKPKDKWDRIRSIAKATTAFILAHELAHHALNHSSDVANGQSKAEELAADQLAFGVCASVMPMSDLVQATSMYFLLLHLHTWIVGKHEGTTHPLGIQRWSALRRNESYAAEEDVIKEVDSWMLDVFTSTPYVEPLVNELRGRWPFMSGIRET